MTDLQSNSKVTLCILREEIQIAAWRRPHDSASLGSGKPFVQEFEL